MSSNIGGRQISKKLEGRNVTNDKKSEVLSGLGRLWLATLLNKRFQHSCFLVNLTLHWFACPFYFFFFISFEIKEPQNCEFRKKILLPRKETSKLGSETG